MPAIANLLVLFETLKTNSKISLQLNRYVLVFLLSCAFLLLSLLCPWISKLVTYFFPLLVSGALSFTTIYLFILSEKHAAKEMSLVHGGKREDIVVQVCEEANFSMYKDHVEVGCFMLKSKNGSSSAEDEWEEDGERVIFAGEVKAGNGDGVLAEDVQSFEIDSMAEGLWNRYFGRCSKWHHIHIDGLVERNVTSASCDDDL